MIPAVRCQVALRDDRRVRARPAPVSAQLLVAFRIAVGEHGTKSVGDNLARQLEATVGEQHPGASP